MKSRAVLTVLVLVVLGVLVGLGTWQLKRLAWKNALVAKIETRVGLPPVGLQDIRDARYAGKDIEYRPLTVEGTFRHDRERHVYALLDGKPGWHVYTPFMTTDGHYIFVNRGFVPDRLKDAASREPQPTGLVGVTGLLRKPPATTSMFTPKTDLQRNRFFWRDFSNMVASVYDKTEVTFQPFFIDERASLTAPAKGWPRAGVTRLQFHNRHLEYAVTWYGLALALAGVYGFFIFGGQRDDL